MQHLRIIAQVISIIIMQRRSLDHPIPIQNRFMANVQAKIKKIHSVTVRFFRTVGASVGTVQANGNSPASVTRVSSAQPQSQQPRSVGSWQQKRVSIKTLEGEFSVTMWASGTDEGR